VLITFNQVRRRGVMLARKDPTTPEQIKYHT